MKEVYLILLVIILFSCSTTGLDKKKFQKIPSANDEVLELYSKDLRGVGELKSFSISLILPLPMISQNSSIVIFDFADKQLKQFNSSGLSDSFNPMAEGPNRLDGSFFKGVGYINNDCDSLFISSNTVVKSYDLNSKSIGDILYDTFETCPSFNNSFYEIFSFGEDRDGVIITQNGSPCYDLSNLYRSVTIENFSDKFFARVKYLKTGEVKYSLKLPNLPLDNIYERFNLHLTYNPSNDRFYAMLNPLTYLFEYRFDKNKLEFELQNSWDLELGYSALPIDYFIEKNHNSEAADLSLDYNFEINFIDAFQDHVFISYHPSKDLSYDNVDEAPFNSHNLLAMIDLKGKKINTYAFNYNDLQFFGTTDNGLWLYDVVSSEQGENSIFTVIPLSIFESFP
jgi:hypothetical protein